MKNKLKKILRKLHESLIVNSIRRGLVTVLPVLLLGSFSLIFRSLPINSYQKFITSFSNGAINTILSFVYDATFGILSVYICFAIAVRYLLTSRLRNSYVFGGALTSVVCFFILSGANAKDFTMDSIGPKGMFTAIFSAVVIVYLFKLMVKRMVNLRMLYADGTDIDFNDAFFVTLPASVLVIMTAIFNYLIIKTFNVDSFHGFYVKFADYIFKPFGRSFAGGMLFVFISSILWTFGIHGSDMLESVNTKLFKNAILTNISLVKEGKAPTEIFTKQFFDLFILMGGCGTTICLLIAIYIFSKRKSNRNLAKIATFPMIFNINELMVFGLPIIYNPFIIIPFVLTPLVCFVISFCAFDLGLVPLITKEVEWTTPVLLSGYKATGSIAGSILQMVNIAVGVMIYAPFVKMYDKEKLHIEENRINELTDILKEHEKNNVEIVLTELRGTPGEIAKNIVSEIKQSIKSQNIDIYYQPQFNSKDKCIGAEALLRYNHPVHGRMYPPLIIKIASESGVLYDLEKYVFTKVASDIEQIRKADKAAKDVSRPSEFKISVNITVKSLTNPGFVKFLEGLKHKYGLCDGEMCIEITEQMAMYNSEKIEDILKKIKDMGYLLAIDDFSMGFTSVKYLQTNQFDIVKLDGSLVSNMITNDRCREIISSIVYLSQSLKFEVFAEYVETRSQMQELEKIGCVHYQGYLYSPAVEYDTFANIISGRKRLEVNTTK